MFRGTAISNFFRIKTVFAAPEKSEVKEGKEAKVICAENIKPEKRKDTSNGPSESTKPRKSRYDSSEGGGGRGGRSGRKSGSPSQGRYSPRGETTKSTNPRRTCPVHDAGDSSAVPSFVATSGCATASAAAGDQISTGSVNTSHVDKVISSGVHRGDKRYCNKGGGVSDLGTSGAGVTGSRADVDLEEDLSLPAGAVYPGLLRHIHNAARYTLPQCFEGACISVKQSTKNNWVLGHSMSFSSVSPGGYKLLLSYVDRNKPSSLPYFVMETAPGGQMSCEFRVGPTENSRAAFVSQISDAEFKSFESIIDLYFSKGTASMIAVNREFIALHYLHGVSKKLSVGVELVARGQISELSAGSGALRWANDHVVVSGTIGNRGLDLCYARAVKPHLTIAAMFEVGFAVRKALATVAYEWRAEDWVFRGSLDSGGLVAATLQHRLGGRRSHLACALSAMLNHPNDKFRLGFGVTAAVF